MNKINNIELEYVKGGLTFSAALFNAVIKAGKYIYTFGQDIGSAIRGLVSGKYTLY